MFNALTSLDAIEGAHVLDLFAGSGALGIEALSRGAEKVTFVDVDRRARRAIETNLVTTGYTDRAEVLACTAISYLRGVGAATALAAEPHTLVLLDPPYDFADVDWRAVLDALAARESIEFLVIESGREIDHGPHWDGVRAKWYGGTLLTILQPARPRSPDPMSPDPIPEPT